MLAASVVAVAMLAVLAYVYGVGFLVFAWWDGGLLRRVLMAAQAGIVVYAMYVYVHRHQLPF